MGLHNMIRHYGFVPLVKILEEKSSTCDGHLCKMNNTHSTWVNIHVSWTPGLATKNKSKYNIKKPQIVRWRTFMHIAWGPITTKGHFPHKTKSPWPLHFKHSHWWKRRNWSNVTSHYTWGTNGVCECKRDVKSTWISIRYQMDHTSSSLGLFSKTTSWRLA
jgi:hypothetical protein